MSLLYIGVGHGLRPSGTFDPGAVSRDLQEHQLAYMVCQVFEAAMKRSGAHVFSESDSGPGHDPDYVGSVDTANHLAASLAVEVHFNAGGGHGTETWIMGKGGQAEQWANRVQTLLPGALRLPDRGVRVDSDYGHHFYFLRGTKMPAILVEVAFIDGDYNQIHADLSGFTRHAGEVLAQATCQQMGLTYKPPQATTSKWYVYRKGALVGTFGSAKDAAAKASAEINAGSPRVLVEHK